MVFKTFGQWATKDSVPKKQKKSKPYKYLSKLS